MRIVLAYVDASVAKFVPRILEAEGHVVAVAPRGERGLGARAAACDLLIVDWLLADVAGIAFVREAHTLEHSRPILVLSGNPSAAARAVAEAAGATDWLADPFDAGALRTVVARVEVTPIPQKTYIFSIDRGPTSTGARPSASSSDAGDGGPTSTGALTVTLGGRRLRLSRRAAAILVGFLEAPGRVFSRRELIATHWPSGDRSPRVLEREITRLRTSLGGASGLLEAVPGVGYRFQGPVRSRPRETAGPR